MTRTAALPQATASDVAPPASGGMPSNRRSTVGETRAPLPYPDGWFSVCFSRDLPPGTVRTVPFMGQDLVLYRTAAGRACAIDPYCPHLGAHLGVGGKVQGEELVCPFHGLAFGPEGGCVRTGQGTTPPDASLTLRYTKEVNGAVMVWADHENRPPNWEVPERDLSAFASPPQHSSHEMRGYPQDTGENSVDQVHFGWLHGLTDTAATYEVGDCWMETLLTACWHGQPMRMRMRQFGMGHVQAESEMSRIGFRVITMLYSTPTAPMEWTMSWIDTFELALFERLPRPLRRAAYALLGPVAKRWLASFAQIDFPIWNARAFLGRPKLLRGDRGIAEFRRWSARFYPPSSTDKRVFPIRPVPPVSSAASGAGAAGASAEPLAPIS